MEKAGSPRHLEHRGDLLIGQPIEQAEGHYQIGVERGHPGDRGNLEGDFGMIVAIGPAGLRVKTQL